MGVRNQYGRIYGKYRRIILMEQSKAVCLVSGGLDSLVALAAIRESGIEVEALAVIGEQ